MVTIILSLFRTPIIALVESTTFEHIMKKGGDYGKIRLWGSVGFIFGTVIMGFLLDFMPIETTLYGVSFFLLLSYLSSIKIPVKVAKRTDIKLNEIFNLMKNKELLVFFLVSFIYILAFAGYHSFFGLYITDKTDGLGYDKSIVGYCTVASVLSEVILLNYSQKILSLYPPFRLLSFTLFITTIRWFILALFNDLATILISQTIHAFSWGLFYVTSVSYVNYYFKDRLRTSGITIYFTIVFGIGNALGFFLAGVVSQHFGFITLFFYCSFLTLLSFIISLYLSRMENFSFRLK